MGKASSTLELRRHAREALHAYGITPSRVTQLAHRHNDVFRIDTVLGDRYVLRIQNNQLSDAHASSQLMWLSALAKQTSVRVPAPVRTLHDEPFVPIDCPSGVRRAVLLRWVPGTRKRPLGKAGYSKAAQMIARLHLHAQQFKPPREFRCRQLDPKWLFGPRFFPSHPRAARHLSGAQRRIARDASHFIRQAMKAAGTGASQFGVIHADLNPDNIIFHQGQPSPIDFDEFGFGWYLFDLAELIRTSVNSTNWIEQKRIVIDSYTQIRPLSNVGTSRFDAFLAATFVQYLNWTFEHARGPRDLRWVGFCIDVIDRLLRGK